MWKMGLSSSMSPSRMARTGPTRWIQVLAGVNVWPKHVEVPGKNLPKKQGLKMCAANGIEIANFGGKVISFTGKSADASLGFRRRA